MTTIDDTHGVRLAIFADLMTADSPAELLPAIRRGIRVRLFVSEWPDPVSGIVEHVYGNAIGHQVAEVRLPSGAIATRNVEHLTVVSPR